MSFNKEEYFNNNLILNVSGLAKTYGNFSIKNINIQLPPGYIMGYVGKNGAGKSTSIKCLMNLIDFSGEIKIFGLDNRKESKKIKDQIGYVSEDHYFYEELDTWWNGNFFGSFFSGWDQDYFNELLNKFDLPKNKKVKELSKGMKSLLSLSIAMGHRPRLFILDEPTTGLDPITRNSVLNIFRDIIQNEECSVFFSSHITSDIEKVADFVTFIDDGSILFSEEKDLIMENWKIIKAETRFLDDATKLMLKGIKVTDYGFSGLTNDLDNFTYEFNKKFYDSSFKVERINLDELLLRMTGGID